MPDIEDPISIVLRRLRLSVEIFQHASYCGTWSVDTSGDGKIPFHLIQQGESWLHLPNAEPQQLRPGDMLVLPNDASHIISSSSDTSNHKINQAPLVPVDQADHLMLCGFFEFHASISWPILSTLPDVIALQCQEHRLEPLTELIFGELSNPQGGSTAVLEASAASLFVYVLREAVARPGGAGLLNAMLDSRLTPVFAAIHSEPAEPYTVESLAEMANLSRSSFAERFKEATGLAPMRYLQNWRLQIAMDLLKSTGESVAQIAEAVGYASEVSFRQTFKKELGMTPSEARGSG